MFVKIVSHILPLLLENPGVPGITQKWSALCGLTCACGMLKLLGFLIFLEMLVVLLQTVVEWMIVGLSTEEEERILKNEKQIAWQQDATSILLSFMGCFAQFPKLCLFERHIRGDSRPIRVVESSGWSKGRDVCSVAFRWWEKELFAVIRVLKHKLKQTSSSCFGKWRIPRQSWRGPLPVAWMQLKSQTQKPVWLLPAGCSFLTRDAWVRIHI